jgi:predicted metal-dependent phosphoesterase TrpH/8-oxo-dGTP pyrophosphatase MutT (NUDIX family)
MILGREKLSKYRRRVLWPGDDLACDMHLHSTVSDGTDSPAQIVEKVIQNELDVFSLTDHDTVGGIAAVQAALEQKRKEGVKLPRFIPGIELSVNLAGDSIHLLGYFPEGNLTSVEALLTRERRQRDHRNREILAKLAQLGFYLGDDAIGSAAESGRAYGRLHIAQALVSRGYFASISDAFYELLSFGRPAYIARLKSDAAEAAALIRDAGGISFVAHPQQYGWCPDDGNDEVPGILLAKMRLVKSSGIDGLEAGHGDASSRQQKMMLSAAAAFGLLASQGSDSHGRATPQRRVRSNTSKKLPVPVLVSAALVSDEKHAVTPTKERRYLLFRRAPSEPPAGFYELAGGKVEAKETPQEALARELEEELGVEGKIGRPAGVVWHEQDDHLLVIVCFETELIGQPVFRVHDHLGWYTAKEALSLNLLPADIALFRRLAGA